TGTVLVAYARQLAGDQVQRFVPRRFAKSRQHFGVIDDASGFSLPLSVRAAHVLRERPLRIEFGTTDKRDGETLGVEGIIKTVATFYTQTPMVDWTLPSTDLHDFVVLNV